MILHQYSRALKTYVQSWTHKQKLLGLKAKKFFIRDHSSIMSSKRWVGGGDQKLTWSNDQKKKISEKIKLPFFVCKEKKLKQDEAECLIISFKYKANNSLTFLWPQLSLQGHASHLNSYSISGSSLAYSTVSYIQEFHSENSQILTSRTSAIFGNSQ